MGPLPDTGSLTLRLVSRAVSALGIAVAKEPPTSGPLAEPAVVDLSGSTALTVRLLSGYDSWRARVVEQVTLTSALSCIARRSLQVAPLCDFVGPEIGEVVGSADRARLVLNVATLPKGPLLGFDVQADGAPAFLLRRREIAERQGAFLAFLAQDAGVPVSERLLELLTVICEFTPGQWIQVSRSGSGIALSLALRFTAWCQRHPISRRPRVSRLADGSFQVIAGLATVALVRYLTSGDFLAGNLHARFHQVCQWQASLKETAEMLARELGEPRDVDSSSENLLLTVPLLLDRAVIVTASDLDSLIQEYVSFCAACAKADQDDHISGGRLLVALSEYGRRWEVLIECDVPLRKSFLVTMCDTRPLKLGRVSNRAVHPLVFFDALSNHAVFRVEDSNVQIARGFSALDPYGNPLSGFVSGIRESREHVAIYGSEERNYLVRARIRLVLANSARWVNRLVEALCWLAFVVVMSLQHRIQAVGLAVLVVPTTFAASLLLTRERSTLATRLQSFLRVRLLIATTALWSAVAFLYETRIH